MKKRLYSQFIVFTLLTILSLSTVLAATNSVEQSLNKIASNLNPILKWLFGDVNSTNAGELLFVKLLFFFLMLAVIDFAVSKVPGILEGKKSLRWVIDIVLSILFVRYLTTPEIVNFVWMPSGILGILIVTFLPFIIWFFFIENMDSRVIRIIGWVLFAVVFFGIALIRWDDFAGKSFNYSWLYIITAVISLIILFFDKDIRAAFLVAEIDRKVKELNSTEIKSLQLDLEKQKSIIASPTSTEKDIEDAKKAIKDIRKKMKALLKS